jgi:ribose transport system substrate-binding protein
MVAGIREEFEAHCPDCKLTFTDVTIAEIATKIQPNVQAALTADPSINYVIALYDSAEVPFAAAAVRAAGRADSIRISTFNGTPEILKMVKDGDLVSMDVGENLNWIAYAIMDQSMRIMGDLEPVEDARVPVRVFDDTNIDETGADFTGGFGEEYIEGYEQLWGLR